MGPGRYTVVFQNQSGVADDGGKNIVEVNRSLKSRRAGTDRNLSGEVLPVGSRMAVPLKALRSPYRNPMNVLDQNLSYHKICAIRDNLSTAGKERAASWPFATQWKIAPFFFGLLFSVVLTLKALKFTPIINNSIVFSILSCIQRAAKGTRHTTRISGTAFAESDISSITARSWISIGIDAHHAGHHNAALDWKPIGRRRR